jgi:hypothetical protein
MDLFKAYEQQPKELQSILSKYDLDALSYEDCKQMLKEVEAIGFTFEYYLDAQPYNLHKLEGLNHKTGTHKDWKFGLVTRDVYRIDTKTFIITDTSSGWTQAQVSLHIMKKLLTGEYNLGQLQFN